MTFPIPYSYIMFQNIPILTQCRNMSPPNTDIVIDNIKNSLCNDEHVYLIPINVLCGQSNFINHLYTNLSTDLKNIAILYKIQSYGHSDSYAKLFLNEMLGQMGHSLHNIGTHKSILERLIKYLIYLSIVKNKKFILIIINNAQNLKANDYTSLATLISKLKEEGIELLLILIGDATVLKQRFTPNIFKKHHIDSINLIELKPLATKNELLYVLNYYDEHCTGVFFPNAYVNNLRLVNDVDTLLSVLNEISTSSTNSIINNIPFEILIQTIEICLKIYGSMGENQYWPAKHHWRQSLLYMGYLEYLKKFNIIQS